MKVAPLSPVTRRWLLASARAALGQALGVDARDPGPAPSDARLDEPARLFVSWHERERLVGCIGTLDANRSLREAVRHYAVEAGLNDPRTPAPRPEDLPRLCVEISLLTAPEPLAELGLEAIAAALVPGRDGLVLRDGERRAVFLPIVWQNLPDPHEFVAALARKAGIDARRRAPFVHGERFFAELLEEDAAVQRNSDAR